MSILQLSIRINLNLRRKVALLMKRAYSLNPDTDENFDGEFHPAFKKQIIYG